jgi:hypothetical protein
VNQGKRYIYSDCERCKGLGWLDSSGHRGTVIRRCPVCDGEGEVVREVPVPLEWPPCKECHQRDGSQLEFMEDNDGEPWDTCSACAYPAEEAVTQPYPLAPPPMLRAAAPKVAGGQVIDVRWFIEARRAEDDQR